MRRKEKEIQDKQVLEELLRSAPVCRIGLAAQTGDTQAGTSTQAAAADAGYPFVVPVHFVYSGERIFIHSARTGRKIEMLKRNPLVCLEIDEYMGLKTAEIACEYGSRFRSLIAFGRARIVEAPAEKQRALQLLMEKYARRSFDFDEGEIGGVEIIEIQIEEMTGKQVGAIADSE